MKFFLIGILTLSSQLYGDYKDTGVLYQDTTKNINQSINLHNNAAEPAKIITTTKIRRVPRYTYYNVYKTRTVWKCTTPPPPPQNALVLPQYDTYNCGGAYGGLWTCEWERVGTVRITDPVTISWYRALGITKSVRYSYTCQLYNRVNCVRH